MRPRLLLTGVTAAGAGALWLQQDLQETSSFASLRGRLSQVLLPEAYSESASLARIDYLSQVPSRADQLRKLADGTEHNPFDILVIGGGATGTGCALDAVTR